MEIYFIRHAHSCGNAKEFSERSKLYKMVRLQTLNPQLSDLGVMQARQALTATDSHGETLKQCLGRIEHVFCSDMMRAMETAALLFPSWKKIGVVPYIGEKSRWKLFVDLGLDRENRAQLPAATGKRLRALGYDVDRFDYGLYQEMTGGRPRYPDRRRFWERVVLAHWMNPESPFCLLGEKRVVRVAVVSHGHFLRNLVSKDTEAVAAFWTSTPLFRLPHCPRPDYATRRPALGNVGILKFRTSRSRVQEWVSDHRPFPVPRYVFETNAVYDPETGECLEYDDVRFVRAPHGRLHHVSRCDRHVREIPSLRS